MIVVDDEHVIEWVAGRLSLHVSNRYCVFGAVACGVGASRPTEEASSHQNVYGPVRVTLATTTSRPAGFVPIVTWYWSTKFAVTVFDWSHAMPWACAPASLQDWYRYWLVGDTVWGLGASSVAVWPAVHQNT